MTLVKRIHGMIFFYIIVTTIHENESYEKTLRKIVRNQSKMVQRPFSDTNTEQQFKNPKQVQMKSVLHKMYRPKMSTILTSTDVGRSKAMFSRTHSSKNDVAQYDLRSAKFALIDSLHLKDNPALAEVITLEVNTTRLPEIVSETYNIPTSKFFPPIEEKISQSIEKESMLKDILYKALTNNSLFVQDITSRTETLQEVKGNAVEQNSTASVQDTDDKPINFFVEKASTKITVGKNKKSLNVHGSCTEFNEAKADIDAQEKFAEFDIEPSWMVNKHFWSDIYDRRYEALMRNAKWPALKIILLPRTHFDTIWKSPFEDLHKTKARRSISNIVKKLKFYSNLTFSWKEVSHLSQWWKGARQKTRTALRSLVEEGRLEITTGGWVETDEATSHLFGILHQLIEGHQWLLYNLNYSPDVAWVTNSVTHSPTLPYLLSSSGIQYLVFTNLHYSWQQYLTEYQCTDFVWVQSWDTDRTAHTHLNEALNRIGNERYSKHSVLSHFLPFNSDGYRACGPQGDTCGKEFDFAAANDSQDIITSNVKEKTEKLLEQYSKSGTTSLHNVIISPLGDKFRFESQTEFDFLYNNYQRIADYVNTNYDIYKATVTFGTSKDYFESTLARQKSFPTLKGDFLNFADISDGSPAYWTGFFTSRPLFKSALRRLQSTLRSTEILFSFALNLNAFKSYKVSTLYERLLNVREAVARLQDRHVVGGTLSVDALRYAQKQIIITAKDCWHIQEIAASLLSSKPNRNETFLEKYLYREGEFITSYKSVKPGDQVYVFNSINQDRIEVVELITRQPNVIILDHNGEEVPIQINPVWKLDKKLIRISSNFFKIIFATNVPPLAFVLYKIKEIHNTTQNAAAIIYCTSCGVDKMDDGSVLVFNLQSFQTGDIQLENHKLRLIIDEYTGFLKTVISKSDSEKPVVVDFGAFKNAKARSGIFLFRSNTSTPVVDVLSPFRQNAKSTGIIIVSGHVTTELTTIYGTFLHHTVKIFNLMDVPLSEVIKLETKVDNNAATEYRDMEIFLSIQTKIENGNPPELFIDNNGFQQTARTVNVSRRVESNVYPFTSMAYVQDEKTRLTIITDHAQGVTVLQEGQLTVMLDRKVLGDDKPGAGEGVAENSGTIHKHYLLIENFMAPKKSYDMPSKTNLKLPSRTASYLADTLNYDLDIFIVESKSTHLCNYAFMPLIKTSFPCEVALINYRVVLYRGTPEKYIPNTALMTLHRQRFCCALQSDGPQCGGDSVLKLDSLLRNVRAVYQTNLVGTSEGVPINVLNKVNFPHSELTTLRIYF